MKVGDTFGRWTVLNPYPGGPRAVCRCTCGLERAVPRNNLTLGASRGCTACRADAQRGPRKRYEVGAKIGFWVVVSDDAEMRSPKHRPVVVRCSRCDLVQQLALITMRNTAREFDGCARCRRADRESRFVSTLEAVQVTGISRQGIHARVKRAWTVAEAQTMPRGVSPPRLIAGRK